MAFDLQITNPQLHPNVVPHRIVPVRFARAVTGFADKDAPDIDDRGFVLPSRFGLSHGPVVGITHDKTIRVKIVRDRLESTSQIFPTIDDASIATIENPASGGALNPNDAGDIVGDCIYLKGVSTTEQETKVKLHFGAADGPVLAELAVRVFPELIVRVAVHAVSINGTASTTTLANAQSIFRRINRIYAQTGVRFRIPTTLLQETVTGFARAGSITLSNVADQQNVELQTVLRQNSVAGALNAYFFGHYFDTANTAGGPAGTLDQVLGIAFSRTDAQANPAVAATGFPGCQAGITFRDSNDIQESAHTAAHEIGHALQLEHYANGQAPSGIRHDIWAHRDLMHNFINLASTGNATDDFPSSVARTQVGYGNYSDGRIMAGELLGIKRIARLRQSDQANILRRGIRNRTFAPI
jgi:Metallo-peptidase family M12B Reprolysin-like